MAHNFQKITAPFGRVSPKDHLVNTTIFARDWVEMFYNNSIPMYASEKIDGTSVGIVWNGERVSFIGHTDKSQFAPRYLEYLNKTFGTPEFESVLEEVFEDTPVTIYGEGISKDYNVHYGFPEGNFIMYDIQNEKGTFYNREAVKEITKKLGLLYPYEEMLTMKQAIELVKMRPQSRLNGEFKLEGYVLRAPVEMYTNNGSRIICKIKVNDFVDVKNYRE
ncbi:MAG: hypothetical protein J6Y78_09050 [Paludibacteraceae bacterium]|nr:hypothetical protein [Paludibacteraceae bacterium]